MSDDCYPTNILRWRYTPEPGHTPSALVGNDRYRLQQWWENKYVDRATGQPLPGQWREIEVSRE